MMSDYDLQFQEDLEKAQALSLESLALEQFRRQKQLSSSDNVRDTVSCADRRREDNEGPLPVLPPPPKKPPRRTVSTDSSNSAGTSPTRASSDLISFASPTSKTPKDPHASFREYIDQISKTTEDIALNASEKSTTMNNHYNQPPYYNAPYNYNYPPQYAQVSPYPHTPYGMPVPMVPPAPNYSYYPNVGQHEHPPTYVATNPMYPPTPPYNQTRMATPVPTPYAGYPPPPQYNYNTTNLISRPTRPASLYPQLNQMHTYPQYALPSKAQNTNSNGSANTAAVVKNEPSRDSVESNSSRKLSAVSVGSNESNDSVGSLPKSLNLIDFGGRKSGSGKEYGVASECSSVYEEYDPLDFLYGETEMREAVYATISKRDTVSLPSPPPKPVIPAAAPPKRPTTNKLYDCIVKIRSKTYDSEHEAFLNMVLDVRKKFVSSDEKTNPGHVIAARSGGKYPSNTSIKVLVHNSHTDEPITFTSDVESTVEHVILTVVCSLDEDIREDMSGYMLRMFPCACSVCSATESMQTIDT